tara:strand:+ start:18 stop:293 length:276 start_codon:yes stop_codon:yes gene_type:complete
MQKKTKVPISVSIQLNGVNLPVYNGMAEINTKQEDEGPLGLVGVFYDRAGICDSLESQLDNYVFSNLAQLTMLGQYAEVRENQDTAKGYDR